VPKFGDTPRFDGDSLCISCRYSHIIKGRGMNDEITLCRAGDSGMSNLRIDRPVMACNSYDDKRIPALYQMEKIAWRFSPDDKKKTMGFMKPSEFKAKQKASGHEEDDLSPPF
jgi:hypothetical protein